MTGANFIALMRNSSKLNHSTLNDIQHVLNKFPYFNSARLLLLKNMQQETHIDYNHQLKIAASYMNDRRNMYEYIMRPVLSNIISMTGEEQTQSIIQPSMSVVNINEGEEQTNLVSQRKIPVVHELSVLEKEILSAAVSSSIYLETTIEQPENRIQKSNKESNDHFIDSEKANKIRKTEEEISIPKTFTNWLTSLEESQHNTLEQVNETDTFDKKRKSIAHLVENFIQNDPRIKPNSMFFSPSNMAKLSITENEDFVTETLAKIYVKQGNILKAVKAYKNLSLKYPEKRDTFASLISDLEKQLKK